MCGARALRPEPARRYCDPVGEPLRHMLAARQWRRLPHAAIISMPIAAISMRDEMIALAHVETPRVGQIAMSAQ